MKKVFLSLLLLIVCFSFAEDINDGPYIFKNETDFTVKYILDGELISNVIAQEKIINYQLQLKDFEGSFDISYTEMKDEVWEYSDISKFFAISDIHGQYYKFVEILKNNKIINEQNNWNWGDGHLVVVGDVFDRGDTVTESLWLIKNLEAEAKELGGKVHFLLGNHEILALNNRVRYVNEKYVSVAEKMGMSYADLFAENSVLGKWVRTRNSIIKINGMLFVHGGISPELMEKNFVIPEINSYVRQRFHNPTEEYLKSDKTEFLFGSLGPFWYRGYFIDHTKYNQMRKKEAITLLDNLNVNYIIVGHTTQDFINPFFNRRFIPIDAGIKYGDHGEGLLWEDGKFYRAKADGYQEELE